MPTGDKDKSNESFDANASFAVDTPVVLRQQVATNSESGEKNNQRKNKRNSQNEPEKQQQQQQAQAPQQQASQPPQQEQPIPNEQQQQPQQQRYAEYAPNQYVAAVPPGFFSYQPQQQLDPQQIAQQQQQMHQMQQPYDQQQNAHLGHMTYHQQQQPHRRQGSVEPLMGSQPYQGYQMDGNGGEREGFGWGQPMGYSNAGGNGSIGIGRGGRGGYCSPQNSHQSWNSSQNYYNQGSQYHYNASHFQLDQHHQQQPIRRQGSVEPLMGSQPYQGYQMDGNGGEREGFGWGQPMGYSNAGGNGSIGIGRGGRGGYCSRQNSHQSWNSSQKYYNQGSQSHYNASHFQPDQHRRGRGVLGKNDGRNKSKYGSDAVPHDSYVTCPEANCEEKIKHYRGMFKHLTSLHHGRSDTEAKKMADSAFNREVKKSSDN